MLVCSAGLVGLHGPSTSIQQPQLPSHVHGVMPSLLFGAVPRGFGIIDDAGVLELTLDDDDAPAEDVVAELRGSERLEN